MHNAQIYTEIIIGKEDAGLTHAQKCTKSKYNGDNSHLTMELKLGLIHTQKFNTIQVTPHKGLKYNVM